jgi:hypothetical protein
MLRKLAASVTLAEVQRTNGRAVEMDATWAGAAQTQGIPSQDRTAATLSAPTRH